MTKESISQDIQPGINLTFQTKLMWQSVVKFHKENNHYIENDPELELVVLVKAASRAQVSHNVLPLL